MATTLRYDSHRFVFAAEVARPAHPAPRADKVTPPRLSQLEWAPVAGIHGLFEAAGEITQRDCVFGLGLG